jgi:hypothetical protein
MFLSPPRGKWYRAIRRFEFPAERESQESERSATHVLASDFEDGEILSRKIAWKMEPTTPLERVTC